MNPEGEQPSGQRQDAQECSSSLREPLLTNSNAVEGGIQSSSSSPAAASENVTATIISRANNQHHHHDDDKDIHIPLPRCFNRRQQEEPFIFSMNHNVLLNLVLCVLYGLSDSLWTGTVIAAYLKKLGHSKNSWVGNVEAASGMASLISALPVGYFADTLGRSIVLKVGGVLLLVTAILHAWLLEWIGTDENDDASARHHQKHAELYLGLIMALWGIGGGIVSGPAQALFADSTPKGNRSLYYVYLFNCYNVASCLGPLVSIGLFQTLGDDWDLYDLRIVIYVGLGLEVVNGILMMFFDDKKALEEEEEEEEETTAEGDEPEVENRNESTTNTIETRAASADTLHDEEQPSPETSEEDSSPMATHSTAQPVYDKKRQAWIPYIIFVHSLIFALGSGMTVKFFPLFFKDEVGMSPSQVQGIYVLVPLVLATCSGLGQVISSRGGLGRVLTAMLFKAVGVSGLYSMVFFKKFLDQRPLLLVPIYIMRTSLMNASYPLEESILMDFVPKKERARWKSLESVASFGWCGSAAIGGWLSDHANGDYTFTFLITAIIQSFGILSWGLLLPLVPKLEGSDGCSGELENNTAALVAAAASNPICANETTLQAPLITEITAALQAPLLEVEEPTTECSSPP